MNAHLDGRGSPTPNAAPGGTIAVVVPGLCEAGGVASVAEFVVGAIERSGRYRARLISLATSARDASSVLLRRPSTWAKGVRTAEDHWRGRAFTHVGAHLAEFEHRRYRPRAALSELVVGARVVQVVCGHPSWALPFVGLGIPVAVQCATRAVVERRRGALVERGIAGWWRRRMTAVTDRLDDRALEEVDCVQVENRWMLDYARSRGARRGVDVVLAPPGIDTSIFRPAPPAESRDGRYFLCVGRLDDPRKDVGLLLDAYAAYRRATDGDVRLVLAGASGPGPTLLARARTLGIADRVEVRPSPSVEALVELYRHATAFVVSSDEEGLGLALLEAMACGTPAISTRCGGPDEILANGGGWLVETNDARGLGDGLAACAGDAAERAGRGVAAQRVVAERYAAEPAGKAFIASYDRLCGTRPVRAEAT